MTRSGSTKLSNPNMETLACDLCQSDQSEVIIRQRDLLLTVTNDEFTIVRCRQCGLIYLNPRPSIELLGSYYPTVYYPPVQVKTYPQFQQQAKKFPARIKRWVLETIMGTPRMGRLGGGVMCGAFWYGETRRYGR